MNGIFPEEAFLSPGAFVQEVFARHDLWSWCLFGEAKQHQLHLIDDALQDFYLTVFRKWDRFPRRPHAVLMASLQTTLRRTFVNILRKEPKFSPLDDLLPQQQPLGTMYHLTYQTYCDQESERLAELLPEQDGLILQKRIEGFDSKEIAEMLDVRPGYVDVRMHRLRKKLRTHFS